MKVLSVWSAPVVNGRSVLPVCGGSPPATACYCGHDPAYHHPAPRGCWACHGWCSSYAQRPEDYRE